MQPNRASGARPSPKFSFPNPPKTPTSQFFSHHKPNAKSGQSDLTGFNSIRHTLHARSDSASASARASSRRHSPPPPMILFVYLIRVNWIQPGQGAHARHRNSIKHFLFFLIFDFEEFNFLISPSAALIAATASATATASLILPLPLEPHYNVPELPR